MILSTGSIREHYVMVDLIFAHGKSKERVFSVVDPTAAYRIASREPWNIELRLRFEIGAHHLVVN